jgi:hypothetical protein
MHKAETTQTVQTRTQKIMSSSFRVGDCSLRLCVYQSTVGGTDYLSACLESKDTSSLTGNNEASSWCLFRMALLGGGAGSKTLHKDSYGRFAADSSKGDNTSLGWNDFIAMDTFT